MARGECSWRTFVSWRLDAVGPRPAQCNYTSRRAHILITAMTTRRPSLLALALVLALPVAAQTPDPRGDPKATEVWSPVPKMVAPGASNQAPPADAIVLFDGKNLDQWISTNDGSPARWTVANRVFTVNKPTGNIETKRKFTNYQLHIEWRIPPGTMQTGQSRGNSGVFLASTGPGDLGYEIQILDSYENSTYVNGQAGAIYKQYPPLVNASRKQGEWQSYDIVWTA